MLKQETSTAQEVVAGVVWGLERHLVARLSKQWRLLLPLKWTTGKVTDANTHESALCTCVQCPLDIATLDIAAALPIATSTPVTNLRQYINSDLGYNDLKIQPLCSKIATVNPFWGRYIQWFIIGRTTCYFFSTFFLRPARQDAPKNWV